MGFDRMRRAATSFTWFNIFYFIAIIVFFIGLNPYQCSIFWVDRLYILLTIPIITGLGFAIAPDSWWSRFFHGLVTVLLLIFFAVIFFAYFLPHLITANCQPDSLNIPGLCKGGKCDNPFNDPRWGCYYANTAEGQRCTYPCAGDLCESGIDYTSFALKSEYLWIFAFIIVFILFMFVSLLLIRYLSNISDKGKKEYIRGLNPQQGLGGALLDAENVFEHISEKQQIKPKDFVINVRKQL